LQGLQIALQTRYESISQIQHLAMIGRKFVSSGCI